MFKYEAYNNKNRKVKGVLAAKSRAEALQELRELGYVPINLIDTDAKSKIESIWEKDFHFVSLYKVKISKKKLYVILSQLAIMIKAGVSLIFALEVLIEGEKEKKIKRIFTEIKGDLEIGEPLSKSMSKFAAFSEVIVNVVAAGELNGRLDDAFLQVSTMIEKEAAIASKVKSALTYPAFLIILTIAVVIILNTVVLPTFTDMFKQFDAELPGITKLVMSSSNFLIKFWPLLILAVAFIVLLYIFILKKSVSFMAARDKLLFKIPVLGNLLKKSYTARFARIMASLVNAGVDILSALEYSRNVIGSHYIKHFLSRIIVNVKLGMPISESMKKYPFFDTLLVSMIRTGEETGMLSETLLNMAVLYENQSEDATKAFTSIIEPVITVFMAAVIGTIIVAVIMPMFNMYSIIGRG